MSSLFITTLIVTIVCCLLMGIGLLLSGKPLEGGCGKTPPGLSRCAGCPNKGRHEPGHDPGHDHGHEHEKCPNRGDH
jgi:hypothetical protein